MPIAALVMNLPAADIDRVDGTWRRASSSSTNTATCSTTSSAARTSVGPGSSGVATEWDFVEAPSQMLENWVYDYDTLATFAVDAQGNRIPRDLVDKMNRARYFSIGMGDMAQLGLTQHLAAILSAARACGSRRGALALPAPSMTCSRRQPFRRSRTPSAISAVTARLITPIAGRS